MTPEITNIWIVVGETGEYSDYSEWNVAGFLTEELANEFRDLCEKETVRGSAAPVKNFHGVVRVRNGFKHAYDSQFSCDYTGTSYRVAMVSVFDKIPSPTP